MDVALIRSPRPIDDGYCNLGVSVDITMSAAMHADVVIAEVNPNMPRLGGDSRLPEGDRPLRGERPAILEFTGEGEVSRTAPRFGKHVADLVPDGATIQIGYGSVPDAILASWTRRRTWACTPKCSPTVS